jgi:hypothetical protein
MELLRGEGALGVRLALPDGAEEVVAFRTDPAAPMVACAGLRSDGRAFARGRSKDGPLARTLLVEGTTLTENGEAIGPKTR